MGRKEADMTQRLNNSSALFSFSFSQCRGLKLYVMFINRACYSSTDSVHMAGSFSSGGGMGKMVGAPSGPGGSQTVLLIRSPQ